jgi:hypothetical protein
LLACLSTSAFAFDNGVSYWMTYNKDLYAGLQTTELLDKLAGAIRMDVWNASNHSNLVATVDTFCVSPSVTLQNGKTVTYRTDLSVGSTGASYLLAHYGATSDRDFNSGLQAAIWTTIDGKTYYNATASSSKPGVAKHYNLLLAEVSTAGWTRTDTVGFDGSIGSPLSQSLGTGAVPEPGTVLAALSILGPAGFLFRRRK